MVTSSTPTTPDSPASSSTPAPDGIDAPRAARQYRELLAAAGFQDVRVEAHLGVFTDAAMLPVLLGLAAGALSAGAVGAGDHDAWVADQRRRAETGRLFLAIPLILAAARKA
ncbi:hypothetical protein [Sinosporangium siamense]|uniref:Uncharacterized protein n=1 Tax=Sinosporangium siamense TaxID=1367973 RepID=A0A919REL0_9ACTN|nr:hypothetical protein [Sinosporangium siamense]GII90461.1 hypothetical protein Ssi02_06920 [Sinosporangium siamense]